MYYLNSGLTPLSWIHKHVTLMSNSKLKTFLSLCCSSLRLLFSPLSFSRSRQGSLAPSSRPCWTRCCMLMITRKRTPPKNQPTWYSFYNTGADGTWLGEYACTYSVTVVRSSLSLRFCSSRWTSFSRSCNRVVSRQTSNSRVFSWSWSACCSASRSWYTAVMFHDIQSNNINDSKSWWNLFLPVCSGSGSPPRWAGPPGNAPESRYAAGFLSSAQTPSGTFSSGCWCVYLDCGSTQNINIPQLK